MSRDDSGPLGHPSGRPVLKEPRERKLPITRNPGIGPLIERLRHPQPKDAIGFHHVSFQDDEELNGAAHRSRDDG
jgi:hypothetical protein